MIRPHVFKMTDTEQALLSLHRENSDLPKKVLCESLGLSPGSVQLLNIAIEKERCAKVWDTQQCKHGFTSLKRARRGR